MRKYLILLVSLFVLLPVWAQDVKLTASGPGTVILGRPFQISYTANGKVADFKAPAITNFDVLAGPFRSESHSTQIINGNVSSSVSISFTLTLQAQKTGTFSIPSASVMADGTKVTSTGLTIKVLPDDGKGNAGQGGGQSSGGQASNGQSSSANISAQNIFIKPILSKSSVFEQEAVRLSYKLYTTYDVVQFSVKKVPEFNGFLKQEYDKSGNTQLDYENFNGRNYLTAVLFEVVLYPQSAGQLTIDKATFEAIIRVQNKQQVRSIFDDFFDSYSNVSRNIDVAPIKINVKPLPGGKPAGYYGLVGQFALNASISANQVKVNEAITLKMNISGNGNMKLLKNPELDFPDAFEVYDPKISNNFKTSTAGLTGNKTIEVMFIPRHAGTYEIPSTEVSFYNPASNSYKVLKTPEFSVQVLKSDGSVEQNPVAANYSRKEDVKQLGNDIRYIITKNITLKKEDGQYLIISMFGWVIFFIPLLIALILFLMFKKYIKENADVVMVKNRKANRMATKRLKLAQKLLKEGKKERFYEEVMKAVWTYLSDKLNIPVAELSKENVFDVLVARKVEESQILRLKDILETCEFARYAPASGQKEMGNLYEDTIDIITTLDGLIKK
jgi:hypothetical protein